MTLAFRQPSHPRSRRVLGPAGFGTVGFVTALAVALTVAGCRSDRLPTLGTRVVDSDAGEVFVSPDGRTLVTLLEPAMSPEKNAPRDVVVGALAMVPSDGGPPRILGGGVTSLPGALQFSSTGSHLAFLSGWAFSRGVGELRLTKLDGGETETLGDGVSFYAFSTDGKRIVWITDGDLFVRATAGGEVQRVASGIYTAQLGPSGTPAANRALLRRSARVDGGLLSYDFDTGALEGVAHGVTAFGFSPDGTAFAFQGSGLLDAKEVAPYSPLSPRREGRTEAPGFYLAALNEKPKRISEVGAADFKFSPTGGRVAFVTPPRDGNATGNLHVARLNGEVKKIADRVSRFFFAETGALALLGAFDGGSGLGTLGLLREDGELVEVSRNVKLFAFSPKGKHIVYSYVGDFGAGFGIGLGTRPVDAPKEEKSRLVDSGVFGWTVDANEQIIAYKSFCESRARSCDLFVARLGDDSEPLKIADKVAAFDFVDEGRSMAIIQSRRADKRTARDIFSLGLIPTTGGTVKVLDDGLVGDFVLAGANRNRLAYVVDATNRTGLYVVDAK